jgi:cytochrome P450
MDGRRCPYVIDPTGRDVQAEAAALRGLGPAVQVELPGGVVAWSINDYETAKKVFVHPAIAKDPRKHWPAFIDGEIGDDWPLISWVRMDSMAIADDDHHRRLRGLVARAFSPRQIQAKRPLIERIVGELLDELASGPLDEPVDLRMSYTYQLPARMICELFGVPPASRAEVLRGGQVAVSTNLTPEQAAANLASWQQALWALVEAKRANPADDMTSDLVHARQRYGTEISDSELVGSLFQLFGAGTETVMNLLNKAVVSLLTHPEQFALVRSGDVGWDEVIEETLRHESPIAVLPLRYATQDIQLDGVTIAKGEPVIISLAAVARDQGLHGEHASSFDITRASKEHLSFGHGVHFCLGAPLARLEASIALPALFDRFPELTLAVPPEELRPQETFIMNGPASLPVHLKPT